MLNCQRELFRIEPGVHYLNCAYQAPLMHAVVEAGIAALRSRQTPYYDTPDIFFKPQEELKRRFAKLIGLNDHERIAIIPSASYGLANVARNIHLTQQHNVVVTAEQFPSNYYAWHARCSESGAELRVVDYPGKDLSWTESILSAIDKSTAVVTTGIVHWTDGTRFDISVIARHAREMGALLVIDGTQSIGALPFDIEEVQPDALICSGYKWLLGPYSLCLGYYGPFFDDKSPFENNWITRKNSDDFQMLVNYQPEYRPKAYRYTVGEPSNFILLPLLTRSIGKLLEWTPSAIQQYSTNLVSAYSDRWREMGFTLPSEHEMCGHLFGIQLPGHLTSAQVNPILKKHTVHVSFRGNALRVSVHLWNNSDDLEALTLALDEIRSLSFDQTS